MKLEDIILFLLIVFGTFCAVLGPQVLVLLIP